MSGFVVRLGKVMRIGLKLGGLFYIRTFIVRTFFMAPLGNYRFFALKSIIKRRLNVKLHLSLYLPYSPTQFSSFIRKIFYLHLHHQKNSFLLLVTTRTIIKGFLKNFKTFIFPFWTPSNLVQAPV